MDLHKAELIMRITGVFLEAIYMHGMMKSARERDEISLIHNGFLSLFIAVIMF